MNQKKVLLFSLIIMFFLSVMPFTLNVASTSAETLPENDFFINPETGGPNLLIVVGSNAADADVVSAAWIASKVSTFFRDNSVSPEELVVLDKSITIERKENYNLLLVGGPVANSIVQELVDLGITTFEEWDTSEGEYKLYEDLYFMGKDVLIVAGMDRDATASAALDFIGLLGEKTYTLPQTPTETPPPETTPPQSWTNATLHAGQEFDLDQGIENGLVSDIFWRQETEIRRYFVPTNGALLANLGTEADFESIDLDYALTAEYSDKNINGSTTYNQIPEETVLLCKTGSGVYVKMIIDEYGYDLVFRYEILGRPEEIMYLKVGETRVIGNHTIKLLTVDRYLGQADFIIDGEYYLLCSDSSTSVQCNYPSKIEFSDTGTAIMLNYAGSDSSGNYIAKITIQYFESEE